jgi:hypothetical protein
MASQITVTATLIDPSGTGLQGNAFVRFKLRNYQGFVPVVTGTAVICETQIDAFPNGSGAVSQALWGNNNITPSTTFYTVEFWDQGRITSSGNYIFNANTNLNTAAQLNAPPVPAGFQLVLENNGVLNSSQNTLNLESTDSSVVITDEGNGTLNLQASSSASPARYMVGPGLLTPPGHADVTGIYPSGDTALDVIATHFNLPCSLVFNTLSFAFIGGSAGINFTFGIYSGLSSATPGTLLWSSGIIAVPNTSSNMEVTVPLMTLSPGDYYLAMSTNAPLGGAQIYGVVMDSLSKGSANIVNHSQIMFGLASNAAATGPVLPSTLGTLSINAGSNSWGYPMVMFYKI